MTTNTRDYRASVLIYREDMYQLDNAQQGMWNVILSGEDASGLATTINGASQIMKRLFGWNILGTAAGLISAMINFGTRIDAAEKTIVLNLIRDGYAVIDTIQAYFNRYPSYEAIQVNLSFLEDRMNPSWRAILCDNMMEDIDTFETEKILVNGTWLEP